MRFVIACVLGGLATAAEAAPAQPDAPAPSVAVTTAPLTRTVVKDRIKVFGSVTLPEQATRDVSFLHAGQITKIDVQQGQSVKAGQALVELTTDPASQLSFKNAQATADFGRRDLERAKALLAQHLATNAQVATAAKAMNDAQAALQNEKALGNDKATEIAAAPADGFVSTIAVVVGDRIAANTVALKLARTDGTQRVTVGLEPDVARRVQPGMVALVSPVYAAPDAPALRGEVRGANATLDATTHLIDTWIDYPAPKPPLANGSNVSVTIIASQHDGWTVPRQTVLHDDKGSFLFTVADGKAKRVDVETGIQDDKATEILRPADPAMPVIVSGNYALKDGMAVRATPAAPAP